MTLKHLKAFLPPVFIKILKRTRLTNYGIYWAGNYSNWEDALEDSNGYDSIEILEKVKSSLLKVKKGEAAYERDSVLFDAVDYDWPVVATLMWVAAKSNGRLNVMDFGGSLGSLYYQNLIFLKDIDVKWNIVEQEHYVECGKKNFESSTLKFYYDIESCLKDNKINLLLLSSVLPYIKNPYTLIESVSALNFDLIFIDKMPLINGTKDRLTVQKIPSSIYKASYPAWFFSDDKFRDFINTRFEIITEFDRDTVINIPSSFKGFLLSKK